MKHNLGSFPNPLRSEEKEYLLTNCHNTSVPVMCKHLGRGLVTIYTFLDENGLKAFRSGKGGRVTSRRAAKEGFFDVEKFRV